MAQRLRTLAVLPEFNSGCQCILHSGRSDPAPDCPQPVLMQELAAVLPELGSQPEVSQYLAVILLTPTIPEGPTCSSISVRNPRKL